MYYIKEATFRRTAEHNGIACAEIQVTPGSVDDPELFVYVARDSSGEGYDIVGMVSSHADLEIDWFNNNLHDAFKTVNEEKFGDNGWPDAATQRQQFKENLLANEEITSKLEQHLTH